MLETTEQQIFNFGDRQFAYVLKRSRRRRRTISVSITSQLQVSVAVPFRTSLTTIENILRKRAPWVLEQLQQTHTPGLHPAQRQYNDGESVEYLGQSYALKIQIIKTLLIKPATFLHEAQLNIFLPESIAEEKRSAAVKHALRHWYHHAAISHLQQRVDFYAKTYGFHYQKIIIRFYKSRWGSCDRHGNLCFNAYLMMAPAALIDYIVVHELCHLIHRNHGKLFWRKVEKILPDYRQRRAILNRRGSKFHL